MRKSCFLWIIVAIFALSACKAQKEYIYQEVRDTAYMTKIRYDSIYFRDSIWIYGDTVKEIHWREKYILKNDTIYKVKVERNDSIVYLDKVKYKTSGYDRFCRYGFWILALLLILIVAWKIIKIWLIK